MRINPRLTFAAYLFSSGTLFAQAGIGTLRTEGARVSGLVTVSAGTATIRSSGTVESGKETSEVRLARGGVVRVCAGSTVAFSQASGNGTSGAGAAPLLIALQRGATEIETRTVRADAILTPDLRIESSDSALLDLRMRVNAGGDTCVENLGKGAPMLHATEQFGSAGYLIKPGQRVLFEHGSVREVVDREGSTCGCPKPGKGGKDDFPEAVSAGLAQPEPSPAPGQNGAQVTAEMAYKGDNGAASAAPQLSGGAAPQASGGAAPVPSQRSSPDTQLPRSKQAGSSGRTVRSGRTLLPKALRREVRAEGTRGGQQPELLQQAAGPLPPTDPRLQSIFLRGTIVPVYRWWSQATFVRVVCSPDHFVMFAAESPHVQIRQI